MKNYRGYRYIIFIISLLFLSITSIIASNSYAISLDGAESFYVNDDGSDNLDITENYTFECWINVDNYEQYDRIFDRRTVFAMSIIDANGSGDFAVRFTERDNSHNILRTLESGLSYDMDLDTWYHVAVTFNGDTAKLFINSDLADSDVDTLWNLSSSTNALNIGGLYNSGYSNQIDAKIDEIRISKIVRSIDSMQISTNDDEYSSDTNTVLLMHLDDKADSPSYISGVGLSGSTGDDDITTVDYVDVQAELPLAENISPEIDAIDDKYTDEHDTLKITLLAIDVNDDSLSFSVSSSRAEVSCLLDSNLLYLIPDTNASSWNGESVITVIVSDGELEDTTKFHFTDLKYKDNINAISLDGNESFAVNQDNGKLDLVSSWTFESWIKIDERIDYDCILDCRTVFSLFLISDSENPKGDYAIRFVTRNGDDIDLALRSDTHESVALYYNNWYHISATYDGTTAKLIVANTVVDTSSESGWNLSTSTNAINIGGRYWGSYERQLHGDIDEVRVSNIARTISDLQNSHTDKEYSRDGNTIFLFHFDDSSATPTYLTGINLEGSIANSNINVNDYVSSSAELQLDGVFTNSSPVLNSISSSEIEEGEEGTIIFSAFDEDGDSLYWEGKNMPSGATITGNNNVAEFNWTPTYTQSNNYNITISVSDEDGGQSSANIRSKKQVND